MDVGQLVKRVITCLSGQTKLPTTKLAQAMEELNKNWRQVKLTELSKTSLPQVLDCNQAARC